MAVERVEPELGAREHSRGEQNRSGAGIQPARVHEELEQNTAGELEHSGERIARLEHRTTAKTACVYAGTITIRVIVDSERFSVHSLVSQRASETTGVAGAWHHLTSCS